MVLKEKKLFRKIKCQLCNVQKMGIFQRGLPMVSVKKSKNFSSLFLSKIVLELMLSYDLERKEAFQDDKNVFCKGQKLGIFQRGQTMVSVKKKTRFFSSLILSKAGVEVMCSDVLARKQAFQMC